MNRAPTRLAAFAVAHMCVSALLRTEACEVSLHIRPKRSLSSNDEDLPIRPFPRKPVDLCASKQSFARASRNRRGNCCDMHNRSELHRVALREYRPICTIAYVSASQCWHPESYHGYAYRVSRLHVLIETRRTAYDPDMEQSDSVCTSLPNKRNRPIRSATFTRIAMGSSSRVRVSLPSLAAPRRKQPVLTPVSPCWP
jgi:hypothetical protein